MEIGPWRKKSPSSALRRGSIKHRALSVTGAGRQTQHGDEATNNYKWHNKGLVADNNQQFKYLRESSDGRQGAVVMWLLRIQAVGQLDSLCVVVTLPFGYQSYQLTASNSQTHAINLALHQAVCVGKAGGVLGGRLEVGWRHQAL